MLGATNIGAIKRGFKTLSYRWRDDSVAGIVGRLR